MSKPSRAQIEAIFAGPVAWRYRGPRGGWITTEENTQFTHGEIAYAAACYAVQSQSGFGTLWLQTIIDRLWPWSNAWWKPTNPRRNLVKAGALILAEIERLDRLPSPPKAGE